MAGFALTPEDLKDLATKPRDEVHEIWQHCIGFPGVNDPITFTAYMSCQLCGSGNEAELDAEMIIHFSGLKNLDKPGLWVFSKVLVCFGLRQLSRYRS